MIKEPIVEVMGKLRRMDFQIIKDNLLLHRSTTSTDNWDHILGFTSKTLKIGESNLCQLVEYGSTLKPSKKYSSSYHKALIFYKRLVRNNERMLINALLYRLHAIIELEEKALKKEFVVVGNSKKPAKEIKKVVQTSKNELLRIQKGIYVSVLDTLNPKDLTVNCLNDNRALVDLIDRMAKVQAHYTFILKYYKRKGIKNNVKEIGLFLAKLNDVIREAITTVSSMHSLMYLCNGIKAYDYDKELDVINKIQSIPFSMDYPDGKNTEIEKVSQMDENAFVEVNGFIYKIETVETEEKGKSSVITLQDISKNKYVKAYLPFSNLAENGIAAGAYCNINGYVRHQSDVVERGTSILIDQLNFSDKNAQSWKEVFFSLSKPIYRWRPYNANMIWSIKLSNY